MTKQQPTQQPTESEPITQELLLRGWNKTLENVNEAARINRGSGVLQPERFIDFNDREPMNIKKKRLWLAQCVNPKTGEFYTLDSLIAGGHMSASERRLFGDLPLPRRELVSMHRVQGANKQEWFSTVKMWYGVSKSGSVLNLTVDDLHEYREILPRFEYMDQDPTVQGGQQVRVSIMGRAEPGYYTAPKGYFTPFTREAVEKAMRDAGPPITERSLFGKTSLVLIKEGVTYCIAAPDLETFINGNFDALWQQSMQPAPQLNVNSKELATYLKLDAAGKEKHQYQ